MNVRTVAGILLALAVVEAGGRTPEAPQRLTGRVERFDREAGLLVFGSKGAPVTLRVDAATRYAGFEELRREDIAEGQTVLVRGRMAEDGTWMQAEEVALPLDPGPPRISPGMVLGMARVALEGGLAVDAQGRRVEVRVAGNTVYHRMHPAVPEMVQKGAGGVVWYVEEPGGVNRVVAVHLRLVPSATP